MLARNLMPVKYLHNRLESDHGKLKRLIKPTLGFQVRRIGRVGWNHTRRRCPESYHDCEY